LTVVTFPQRDESDGSAPHSKPKVLLVDDHPDILKSTSRLLSFDFEIVGTASDGYQAVDAAQRLDPDVIALDITMPGRDGFETAQQLVQIGTRARIVFLTMHESDDYVSEGFRSGGRGYVLKTRLHLDLANALRRVLSGQLFVPSLAALFAIDHDFMGHAVHFHEDDRGFVEGVSGFIAAALRRGDAVSLVTKPAIRAGVAQRLRTFGWNVGESGDYGAYRAMDSAAALELILRREQLDIDRMRELVAETDRTRMNGSRGADSILTFVGDISTHLLDVNPQLAVELEQAWTDATQSLRFLTVCCYATPWFESADAQMFPRFCAEHLAVAHLAENATRSLTL
jgi:CheY-like chemotaxis protein